MPGGCTAPPPRNGLLPATGPPSWSLPPGQGLHELHRAEPGPLSLSTSTAKSCPAPCASGQRTRKRKAALTPPPETHTRPRKRYEPASLSPSAAKAKHRRLGAFKSRRLCLEAPEAGVGGPGTRTFGAGDDSPAGLQAPPSGCPRVAGRALWRLFLFSQGHRSSRRPHPTRDLLQP